MDIKEVVTCLHQLDTFNIINYIPQKDSPQLYFIQNRVRADELVVDMQQYNERKKHYRARVESFIRFIRSKLCRSQSTGNYFGDENMKTCGICDNCLLQKKLAINGEEFSTIQQRIMSALYEPVHSRDLMQLLHGIKKKRP